MMNFLRTLVFLLFLSLSIVPMQAQIGINTETPSEYSELDIQNAVVNGNVVPKGVLIPRMTESERNSIDVITSADEANSLLVYNTDEGCYNYYSKIEGSWRSLCGQGPNAEFDLLDCNNIVTFGNYVQSSELDASNYLRITVNVTQVGSYAIDVITTNGYYFRAQGVAPSLGKLEIDLSGHGTPRAWGTDALTFSGITLTDNCSPTINVQPQVATYSINCDNITVAGEYYKNVALKSTNYIEVSVNVSSLGSYYIVTETANGVYFEAKALFETLGVNYVKLYGTGTPTVNEDFDIKITTNSPSGVTQCTTTIPIILPAMTYAIIGASSAYTWGGTPRSTVLGPGQTSFSKTGVVRMVSFTQLWSTTNGATAASYLSNGFGGKYPDVVLAYALDLTRPNDLAPALADYIKKGGCVIYGSADYGTNSTSISNTKTIFTEVFGSEYAESVAAINTVGTGDDSWRDIYPLVNNSNDPIINGPFGNAAGQYWGEDNAGSVVTTFLPPHSVQLASANNNERKVMDPSISIVWYNNNYNFVYFGDCVGASTSISTTYYYPAYYPNNEPGTKLFGKPGNMQRYVYNSVLELNAVAWCIRKAVVSGINPY